MSVKVGDTVLIPEYGGTNVTFEEKVLLGFKYMMSSLCYYI